VISNTRTPKASDDRATWGLQVETHSPVPDGTKDHPSEQWVDATTHKPSPIEVMCAGVGVGAGAGTDTDAGTGTGTGAGAGTIAHHTIAEAGARTKGGTVLQSIEGSAKGLSSSFLGMSRMSLLIVAGAGTGGMLLAWITAKTIFFAPAHAEKKLDEDFEGSAREAKPLVATYGAANALGFGLSPRRKSRAGAVDMDLI
jgi:hypothetical protein